MSDKDTIRQVINGQIRQEDVDSQLQDILNSKMRSRMNAAQGISDESRTCDSSVFQCLEPFNIKKGVQ